MALLIILAIVVTVLVITVIGVTVLIIYCATNKFMKESVASEKKDDNTPKEGAH